MFRIIFQKEMKDVLRDKRSITLLVIFPVLMMTALTFFYDKLLTVDQETEFSLALQNDSDPAIIEQLEPFLPEMTIKKVDDVKKAVEEKDAQVGLAIDPDWLLKLSNQETVPVKLIFDPGSQESASASNLVMNAFSEWQNEMVGIRLADQNIDKQVIEVFQVEAEMTKNEENAIASFMLSILIPLLIPIAIANGSYPSATELFAGEKEKKTIEALLITPVKPLKILLAKWLTISLLGVFTGVLCVGILGLAMNFTVELKKGLSVIANPLSFVVMSIVLISLFAIFIAEIEMMLSMLANSVKEAGYYITPVMSSLTLPMLFMFFSDEALNIPLYAIPALNLFLFVRDGFSGQLTVGAFGLAAGSYTILIAILFPIALKLFSNHRLMLGK